jgi:hypothetical protein
MSAEEKDSPAQNAPKTFSEIMEKLKAESRPEQNRHLVNERIAG